MSTSSALTMKPASFFCCFFISLLLSRARNRSGPMPRVLDAARYTRFVHPSTKG
jgi:hypothetical protein